MQQELQQALANLINKTTSGAEYLGQKAVDGAATATEFLKQEIPDVIKQLLLWEFTYYFVLFVCGVILVTVTIYYNYKIFNHIRKNWESASSDAAIGFVFGYGLVLFLTAYSMVNFIYPKLINIVWLKIWLAPKLYLIQYAANLIKG